MVHAEINKNEKNVCWISNSCKYEKRLINIDARFLAACKHNPFTPVDNNHRSDCTVILTATLRILQSCRSARRETPYPHRV